MFWQKKNFEVIVLYQFSYLIVKPWQKNEEPKCLLELQCVIINKSEDKKAGST